MPSEEAERFEENCGGEKTSDVTINGAREKSERIKPEKSARLTKRDFLLFGHLAVARYLTMRQIASLIFPGRVDRIVRRRLEMLSTTIGMGAHVVALRYRAFNGAPMFAWRLSELGYANAPRALGREIKMPSQDIGYQLLEHTIRLNDLYVALATANRVGRTSAQLEAADARQAFRWTSSESARLPWAKYERERGEMQNKRIEPDAILESANAARRWFLECEMGGHSLSNDDENSGSTLSKLRRYAEFYSGFSDSTARITFYKKAYPDGWPGELAFLVPTTSRRDSIQRTIDLWRKEDGQTRAFESRSSLRVFVATFEEAPSIFQAQLNGPEQRTTTTNTGKAPVKTSSGILNDDEAIRLMKFTDGLYDQFKIVRADARGAGRPIPAYPSETERDFVVDLLTRKGLRRTA